MDESGGASDSAHAAANPAGDFVDVIQLFQQVKRKNVLIAFFKALLKVPGARYQLLSILQVVLVVCLQNRVTLFLAVRQTNVVRAARRNRWRIIRNLLGAQ